MEPWDDGGLDYDEIIQIAMVIAAIVVITIMPVAIVWLFQ